MEETVATDDVAFLTAVDATPLQIEKAKVQALKIQLSRSLEEKRQLQSMLEQTQIDLEKQIKNTLRLQKNQAQQYIKDAIEKQASKHLSSSDDTQELKTELASMQIELADEIARSKTREARAQRLQDQCNAHEDQVESLKQQYGHDGEENNEKRRREILINNLKHQRCELLTVVKKQMKLIDILKQQRSHVEQVALLNITEKDFMKEVNRR